MTTTAIKIELRPPEFRVVAQGVEILLFDDVGFTGTTAKAFVESMQGLDPDSEITLRINSPGGNVFHALAIYNALKRHPGRVVARVEGLAASSASLIAMAGERIEMAEAAMLMIHEPVFGVLGDADDMKRTHKLLDQIASTLADIYAARSGQSVAKVRRWMKDETWFSASEAVEAGLASGTVEGLAVAARLDPARYEHTPPHLKEILAMADASKVEPKDHATVDVNLNVSADQKPSPAAFATVLEPIKMSAAEFATRQPEEAQKLTDAATKTERDRVAAITAAFKDDGEFLTTAVSEGWSVDKAKAEHHDVLAAKLAESEKEKANLVAAGNVPGFAPSDGGSASPEADKYRHEYRANAAIYARMGVTEEQFIRSRKITDGSEVLAVGNPLAPTANGK